ncbi:site-specific integrase [uncultured Desulfosarcina sp.]|uniref:tyrosine-type recombinase/integrase n=1 Tax=uncultured Desulfosarcina sp. TaxID=218289 RepID=UPI0029C89625|nr:site-specific integrase [uncultured Desulfosarcina sp.]
MPAFDAFNGKFLDKKNYDMQSLIHFYKFDGGECVSGSIQRRRDTGAYYILWWDIKTKKQVKIYRYKGEKMFSRSTARKLLSLMQNSVEEGTFRLERFTRDGWTDVLPMLRKWEKATFIDLKPGTRDPYRSYLKNWIRPYFKKNPVQLHEIQIDVLKDMLHSIAGTGKHKQNVMFCFHSFMDYCWRARRIVAMPPFPKKKEYGIVQPAIKWLPESRQLAILEKIPQEHKPIFYFMKYTMRRPGEAMAIHREDVIEDGFVIQRAISSRKLVDSTKTGEVHYIPCHDDLAPYIEQALKGPVISQFLFTCKSSRNPGKRYSHRILSRIWRKACADAEEDINMYSGLKHSSCSQYINEKGLSQSQVQALTDHARIDSVKRYAKTEIAERKRLMMTLPIEKNKPKTSPKGK